MGVPNNLFSPMVILFYFMIMLAIPEHSFAGITRSYKFDVCLNQHFAYIKLIYLHTFSSLEHFSLIVYIYLLYLFVDQTTKCDKTVPHKEHCDG